MSIPKLSCFEFDGAVLNHGNLKCLGIRDFGQLALLGSILLYLCIHNAHFIEKTFQKIIGTCCPSLWR